MIIGISGKKQHGKDTVGRIIRLLDKPNLLREENKMLYIQGNLTDKEFPGVSKHIDALSNWEIKKFADKLKRIACMIIGCTMEQLEDDEFKNAPLGEEWDCYERQLTPRLLLQLLGTECGRQIIHPNIWVNSLMADYNINENTSYYPNWIVTDVRFSNEADAIREKGGLLIRVNRPDMPSDDTHASEIALDDYPLFDTVIDNDGTIQDLIDKMESIYESFQINV